MNVFAVVKENVTARQVAMQYGIKINRSGLACCPFHKDRHPSMKADKIYHCFACGVGGDAIDFTARLFGISQYEAAKKLVEDFGLNIKVENRSKYERTPRNRAILKQKQSKVVMIREKLEQWLKHATDVLIRYLKWIQFWKEFYKPEPEEEWHELFTEALANERKINDYLDVLMFGTGEEIVEFFKMKRREVEKIEERINEYQREVLDGIRRYCERGDAYNRRCQ
jgi:DNA-directed RNA polymerase subunit N (RpoN/RPB10)